MQRASIGDISFFIFSLIMPYIFSRKVLSFCLNSLTFHLKFYYHVKLQINKREKSFSLKSKSSLFCTDRIFRLSDVELPASFALDFLCNNTSRADELDSQ